MGTGDDNAYPPSQTYAFSEEQLFRYYCEHALLEATDPHDRGQSPTIPINTL